MKRSDPVWTLTMMVTKVGIPRISMLGNQRAAGLVSIYTSLHFFQLIQSPAQFQTGFFNGTAIPLG